MLMVGVTSKMFNNFKAKIEAIWKRLTWIHIISIHPNTDIMKDKEWYVVNFYIKREGKYIKIDNITIKNIGLNRN